VSFGREQELVLNWAAVDLGEGVWLWSRRQKGSSAGGSWEESKVGRLIYVDGW
jgi:hypothetical protein